MWFRGGDLYHFQDIWQLPVSEGPWPPSRARDLYTFWCAMTQETRINMVYKLGSHPFAKYLGISYSREVRDNPAATWHIYHSMSLDAMNINVYCKGVGITTILKKFGHFLFRGGVWSVPPPGLMTYIQFDVLWHKEQEYLSIDLGQGSQ